MAFQLSPGVLVREQDATAVVPAVGTTVGGFAGDFAWGPARELVSISGENELVERFGKPAKANNVDFLTASSFLAYGSNLLVSREVGATAKNAVATASGGLTSTAAVTAGGSGYTSAPTVSIAAPTGVIPDNGGRTATATATITGDAVSAITITDAGYGYAINGTDPVVTISGGGGSGATATVAIDDANPIGKLIRNDDEYDASYAGETNGVGPFAAKYAGILGNSLKVSVGDIGTFGGSVSMTVTISAGGSGYSSAPTVAIGASPSAGGTAVGVATLTGDAVSGVTIAYPGFGYTSAPAITFSGGGGSGATATTTLVTQWVYEKEFDTVPGTTDWAASNGVNFDELHVIVIDENGAITGKAGTVLEKFEGLSKIQGARADDNSVNYYKDAINAKSKWIRFTDQVDTTATSVGTAWGQDLATTLANETAGGVSQPYPRILTSNDVIAWSFSGGVHVSPTNGDIQTSYLKFANDEETDVSLIFAGAHSSTVGDYIIDNVTEIRKDCLAFVSPAKASVVNNSGSEVTDITAELSNYTRSSFAVMDSGWKYMYDRYNDVYAWVPCNADTAGCCVTADLEADPWFSPAGVNRGSIKNAVKLAFNPKKSDRDTLYSAGVNPIVQSSQQGIILFGDKTLLARSSAFNRINVRRLFIVIEKAVAAAAKFQLFEFNDAFTRAQFRSLVEPFLRDVQGRRGVYDFRVVCDETNNTGQVIDSNEFRADIFIKPAKSINFITLTFVATRTGISFEELGA